MNYYSCINVNHDSPIVFCMIHHDFVGILREERNQGNRFSMGSNLRRAQLRKLRRRVVLLCVSVKVVFRLRFSSLNEQETANI